MSMLSHSYSCEECLAEENAHDNKIIKAINNIINKVKRYLTLLTILWTMVVRNPRSLKFFVVPSRFYNINIIQMIRAQEVNHLCLIFCKF